MRADPAQLSLHVPLHAHKQAQPQQCCLNTHTHTHTPSAVTETAYLPAGWSAAAGHCVPAAEQLPAACRRHHPHHHGGPRHRRCTIHGLPGREAGTAAGGRQPGGGGRDVGSDAGVGGKARSLAMSYAGLVKRVGSSR